MNVTTIVSVPPVVNMLPWGHTRFLLEFRSLQKLFQMSVSIYCCWIQIFLFFLYYSHDFGCFLSLYRLVSSTTVSLLEVRNIINPTKCLWNPKWKCRYSREVTFLLFKLALLQCLQITKHIFIFAYHITPGDTMLDRISCFSIDAV